jgi:hypothetical protein
MRAPLQPSTDPIRRGNFYSSCGPELRSIVFDGVAVHLLMSPVRFVRLVDPGCEATRGGSYEGSLITEVTMPVPMDWSYVFVEIEDEHGRRAWTHPLFVAGDSSRLP